MNKRKVIYLRMTLGMVICAISILLNSFLTPLISQSSIYPAPKGVYIVLGKEFPKDFSYRISRKSNTEAEYKTVSELSAPLNREEFESRLNDSKTDFFYLDPVSKESRDRYWEYFTNYNSIDSLLTLDPALTYISMGIGLLDTSAIDGITYEYKVEKMVSGRSVSADLIEPFKYKIIMPESTVSFFSSNYDGITTLIKWTLDQEYNLQRYVIFRRDNLKGDFQYLPINLKYTRREDTTYILLLDTLTNEHEVYEYRIAPVDLFGNLGEKAEPVTQATFSDYDFPYLKQFDAVSEDNRQVKVTWNFENKAFLRSIKLMRSMTFDSGFVKIAELPPTDTAYVDYLPVAMENYYYRLILNGPLNTSKLTVATRGRYLEKSKPSPPVNFKGIGLSNGVQLEWDDQEAITLGFYVFRQDIATGDMELISDLILIDSSRHYIYQDTSQILRGDILYKYTVQTVNDGFQTSDYSDTIAVRPNIPTFIEPPSGLKIRKEGNTCYLFWNDQGKINANLDHYILYRKRSDENDFRVIAEIPSNTNHFQDTSIISGYGYDYKLQSRDYFGSTSTFTKSKGTEWFRIAPAPPSRPRVSVTAEGIMIRWNEMRQKGLKKYNIYRYLPGQEAVKIGTSDKDQFTYLDANVESNQLYFYYLTTVNDHGIESGSGKAASIRR